MYNEGRHMKIGVMSDTHDNLPQIEKAIRCFQKEQVGLIIHCGDWVSPFVPRFIYALEPKLTIPVKSVFGNNEGDRSSFYQRKEEEKWDIEYAKSTLSLDVDGKKIAVYHGTDELITHALIMSKTYDAVFTGHTHVPLIETKDGVLHVNPGSTTGNTSFRIENNASVAIYDTQSNAARLHKL